MVKFRYVILIICFVFSCKQTNTPESTSLRPNIVLIMADDLGYETIWANGGRSYQTPALNRMASEGMRFEHCYAQPLCTPSRVQLMTGIYNVRNYVRFGLLDEGQTTFGHLFQKAGYRTCVVGKWQLGKDSGSPQKAGFDNHCLWQVTQGRVDSIGRDTRFSQPVLEIDGIVKTFKETDYGPEIVSDYGLDFIEKSHQSGKPFLLYYPMILTHCPFSPTPNSPEWNQDTTAVMSYKGEEDYFGDMVFQMDEIVGKINNKLKQLGLENNTLVIFTGDNGTDEPVISTINGRQIAGAKGKSTDAGTRVPLIVKWPEVIPSNSANNDLIDFSDFLPTLGEVADIKLDSLDIDGISFLPQLKGELGNPREWIYSWYSREGKVPEARIFARNHQFKLYTTGEFYDVPKDYEEQSPLDTSNLDSDVKEIYGKLKGVLQNFSERRLDMVHVLNKENDL
ncbi:MAG: sulfatase-like hydrolase/transferase [Aurantibacter sp.]